MVTLEDGKAFGPTLNANVVSLRAELASPRQRLTIADASWSD